MHIDRSIDRSNASICCLLRWGWCFDRRAAGCIPSHPPKTPIVANGGPSPPRRSTRHIFNLWFGPPPDDGPTAGRKFVCGGNLLAFAFSCKACVLARCVEPIDTPTAGALVGCMGDARRPNRLAPFWSLFARRLFRHSSSQTHASPYTPRRYTDPSPHEPTPSIGNGAPLHRLCGGGPRCPRRRRDGTCCAF